METHISRLNVIINEYLVSIYRKRCADFEICARGAVENLSICST